MKQGNLRTAKGGVSKPGAGLAVLPYLRIENRE